MVKKFYILLILSLLVAGCSQGGFSTATRQTETQKPALGNKPGLVPQPARELSTRIPNFDHVFVIMLENRNYKQVIGSPAMPYFNELADNNVLFSDYYGVGHPSQANYLAITGGSTFGVHTNCVTCYVNDTNIADLIEQSGRTWKTYQENMPYPCFIGDSGKYVQRHNPFIYYDDIRTDKARCRRSVVPLTELSVDIKADNLPNYAFIMPNLCDSAHDCNLSAPDQWLKKMIPELQASQKPGEKYMILITFDEDLKSNIGCCGFGPYGGGHVATILISPQAKDGFVDATPYSHYSALKTILEAWNLPPLGFTAKPETNAFLDIWK